MKILEIRLFGVSFQNTASNRKASMDFKTKDFSKNRKILERLRQSFGFEIESNMDLNESGHFLLALLNLKQYIITKINA
jgi:hypothetical protein